VTIFGSKQSKDSIIFPRCLTCASP